MFHSCNVTKYKAALLFLLLLFFVAAVISASPKDSAMSVVVYRSGQQVAIADTVRREAIADLCVEALRTSTIGGLLQLAMTSNLKDELMKQNTSVSVIYNKPQIMTIDDGRGLGIDIKFDRILIPLTGRFRNIPGVITVFYGNGDYQGAITNSGGDASQIFYKLNQYAGQ
jgi:hypothetical protein